jgi:hypothetical protein
MAGLSFGGRWEKAALEFQKQDLKIHQLVAEKEDLK